MALLARSMARRSRRTARCCLSSSSSSSFSDQVAKLRASDDQARWRGIDLTPQLVGYVIDTATAEYDASLAGAYSRLEPVMDRTTYPAILETDIARLGGGDSLDRMSSPGADSWHPAARAIHGSACGVARLLEFALGHLDACGPEQNARVCSAKLREQMGQAMSLRADSSRMATLVLPYTFHVLFESVGATANMPANIEPFVHMAFANTAELYQERVVRLVNLGALVGDGGGVGGGDGVGRGGERGVHRHGLAVTLALPLSLG